MTVLDTSVVVDYLLSTGVADAAAELLAADQVAAAPDLLTFEVLAVLRRDVVRGLLTPQRAQGAVDDLGDLSVELYSSLVVRQRAWELRENFTAADALFVALAERLGEPLATKDGGLAASARSLTHLTVIELPGTDS
jgi:predicted nucleic acid-binding protein